MKMFEDFIDLCETVDEDMRYFTVCINDQFQYADADATDRFLVFHDKNNKPDAYRFLHPTIDRFEEKEKALKSSLKSF
jgi:hypothetical protein